MTDSKNINKDGGIEDIDCKNPLDKLAISVSDEISPLFKKMNYAPLGLTTISVIFSVAAMYHLYRRELVMFSVYAVLFYLFNRTDDVYAKKYGFSEDLSDDRYGRFKDLLTLVVGIY